MPNATSGHRQPVTDMTARRSRMLGPLQAVRAMYRAEPDLVPPGSARSLLTVLATYADADTYESRPGRLTLARETGQSRSTLRRSIRALEAAGVLVTLSAGTGDRASRYRITLPQAEDKSVDNPTVPTREGVHHEPRGGSPRTRGGVHHEPRSVRTDIDRGGDGGRCPTHAGVPVPPPCQACRRARLAAEEDEAERIRLAALQRRDDAIEEARRAVIAREARQPAAPGVVAAVKARARRA